MLHRRRSTPPAPPTPPSGVVLGQRLAGGPVLPLSGGDLVIPYKVLSRHAVILGKSGSGKTETVMRLADGIATGSKAPVFYLDAKGDRGAASRFVGLMAAAGRRVRVFPNERFDAWRGDAKAIANRLLEVIAFTEDGPAAYYRDIAKTALQLACNWPEGPPRSSAELLHRLDLERLAAAAPEAVNVRALLGEQLPQVRMRYEAFFGQVGSLFDGEWSWEDTDAAYFLLDSIALGEDATTAASMLFADFAHYFTVRKPRSEFCVMFVDEFSSLASRTDMAVKVEQARVFNTGFVLVPQVVSGMGGTEQRDRILGSVETVVVHALNDPEEIIELAGTKRVPELSYHFEDPPHDREGFVRYADRSKIDPNRVRELEPGIAWVIRRGRVGKVRVYRAPEPRTDLPEVESTDPLPRPMPAAPKHDNVYDRLPSISGDHSVTSVVQVESSATPTPNSSENLAASLRVASEPVSVDVAPKHLDIYDDLKGVS